MFALAAAHRSRFRRRQTKVCLSGLVCVALAAIAGAEPTELTIWGANFTPDTKGYEAMVKEFERRNPDIRVRALSMGAGKMDPQKLMTAIVGNVAPDVVKQDRFTIGDWASRGAFLNLAPLIARDRATDPLCPKREDYYAGAWTEASYQGGLYAIPESADNRVLYWNRGLFKANAEKLRAAGLDPTRAPRTWSELLAYSKVLTVKRPDGSLERAGFIPLVGDSWFYLFAFQNNANFMSADGRTCTLSTPEAEEALQFIVDGYNVVGGYDNARKLQSGFQSGVLDPFIIGKVAMKIDGDWILKDIAKNAPELDFANAPAPVPDARLARTGRFRDETEPYVTWSGGFSWTIPKGARHVEAGWRFIKFAASKEGRLIEAQSNREWALRRGREFVPALGANRLYTEATYRLYAPKSPRMAAGLRTHVDMQAHARTRAATFVGQQLWDEHARATERACSLAATPHQALIDAQRVVQAELDEAFSQEKYPKANVYAPVIATGTILACALTWFVWSYRRARLGRLARLEARAGYWMIAPWAFGFITLTVGPMVASLMYSFSSYSVLAPPRWVGLKNYQDAFGSNGALVAKAFFNAFYLAGVGVPLGLFTGLTIAILLNSATRGIRLYRTFFYMPAVVPATASATLWIWLLAADPNKGLINAAWSHTLQPWFDLSPPAWLMSEHWSKPALALQGLWGAGGGMLLWLAGLKGIPRSLYEAAEIDGASALRSFWNVTLPMLSPIVFFSFVMGFIGAIQEFDRVYVMRPDAGAAGPNDSMLSPVYHLFQNGFGYFKMGYASAIAWLIFAVIVSLTIAQFKLKSRWVYEELSN